MALTIDELNIQIAADSKNATRAINNLAKTLERLNTAAKPVLNSGKQLSNALDKTAASADKAGKSTKKSGDNAKKSGDNAKKGAKGWAQLKQNLLMNILTARTFAGVLMGAARTMADMWNESNEYIETLNLFKVTMGDASDEALAFANNVSKAMGIDIADWMQYQGTFKNLTSGFGVASDKANVMSQNLTQLSYDLASFFNTDVETAFDKLSSAMAGQVKGLREFGIDTTVASLQEYALSKGIDASVRSMSQAEKSLLRYNYIMEKSTIMQGDMARTLITPANSLRILSAQFTQLKRAIGNVISVVAVKFIPYVKALVEIVTEAATALANFFGFKLPEIDYSSLGSGFSDEFADAEDSLGGVSDSIKKIKKQLMGFDELNIISNPDKDSGSGGSGGASGGGAGLDLEALEYDFLGNLETEKLDEFKEKVKDILFLVGEIGLGFLAWKLSKGFLGTIGGLAVSLGLILVVDGIKEVLLNGLSWESVIKGAIGGALVGAAIGFKFGGVGGALLGAVIGIGVTLAIEGITSIVTEGVTPENVITTIVGALTTIGGIVGVIKKFNKGTTGSTGDLETAGKTVEDVGKGTSKLTSKLKEVAKNLGLGLVILVEVAAAAIIFTGAIAILGWELEQVGKAWQPVIDNGGTVAAAVGIGTALLVAVGVATALLGTLGWAVAGQIGIGILILAELGVATGLFLAEIWAIGWGLDQIRIAWQPVLDNGETVAAGIGIGTGLLVAIGVVTAALGAATVASAGALPLAIGLGTALLVELAAAFVLFVASLVEVASQLNDELHPELEDLNDKLPGLSRNMRRFTQFMSEFASCVVDYTKSSVISGIAATIDKIVDFFTTDPVQRMSDEVAEQNVQFDSLIKNLEDCIPDIEYAIKLVKKYNKLMSDFANVSGGKKPSILTFLTDVVTGVWKAIKTTINSIIGGIEKMVNSVISGINSMIRGLNSLKFDVPDWVPGIGGKNFGLNINTVSTVSIPRLAEGGIVGEGQMFIAREAGPELVGNIGRKTAVANNDQIVSGIESGVYRAMMAANSTKQGGTTTIRIVNEIDGDKVGEKVIQYHNGKVMQTGVSPLLV